MKLLEKKSKTWIILGAIIFALVFGAMWYVYVSQIGEVPRFENFSGFALLSIMVALVVSVGGYLGAKHYAIISAWFAIIGVVSMVMESNSKPLQQSLAGLLTFFIIFMPGLIFSVILQVYINNKQKKP